MNSLVSRFYAIRTVAGQEHNVALLIESRVKSLKLNIRSIMVFEDLKGFVFIESPSVRDIDRAISGLRHIKGRVRGSISFSELEKFVYYKPIIESIKVDDIVEIVHGPFRGMKGKVRHVDKSRGEIVLEILDATYPFPVTINAEDVKIVKKAEKSELY